MRFSSEFLDKVRNANNLVDIIGQFTQLKSSGKDWMGRCPFPDHPEKTPSFSVSEAKQVYYCFGCKKSGNTFDFLSQYQGMSFVESVEYLAQRAGLPIPTESYDNDRYQKERELKRSLFYMNHLARDWFYEQWQNLKPDTIAKTYFSKRGLSEATIATFKLGYAPDSWEGFVSFLRERNEDPQIAETARLIRARQGSQGYYDLFRDRVMVPIVSPTGEVVGFGGRILDQGEPKYLNSPESPIFSKGRILFGLDQSAKFIRAEDAAIVVEGYMDALSLFENGIRNVVASMGTALTIEQAKLIRRYTRNVVVVFDGDRAGQEAQDRSLISLLQADLLPKGFSLPAGMDPDDFVKEYGADLFRSSVSDAKDLFLASLDRAMTQYHAQPTEQISMIQLMRPVFAAIQDPHLKELYLKAFAEKLEVELSWLKKSLWDEKHIAKLQAWRAPLPASAKEGLRSGTGLTERTGGFVDHLPSKINAEETVKPDGELTAGASEEVLIDQRPFFDLSPAPAIEVLIFALSIKSHANFTILANEREARALFSHGTLSELFDLAHNAYLQDSKNFDSVLGLISSKLKKPEPFLRLVFIQDRLPSADEIDTEKKNEEMRTREAIVIRDGIRKLKVNRMKDQLRLLRLQLKTDSSEEIIQKLQALQLQISELDKKA